VIIILHTFLVDYYAGLSFYGKKMCNYKYLRGKTVY